MYSPSEVTRNLVGYGKAKAERGTGKLLLLGVAAGLTVGFASAATSTAAHGVADTGTAKLIAGVMFPFALCVIILTGMELFTGSSLITAAVLDKQAKVKGMLRNWALVYFGNMAGTGLVAAVCAFSGQFDYSYGGLALYTMKTAAAKCSLSFGNALVLGICCNVLVCAAIMAASASKEASGKILGAYGPVAFFVMAGFEHCVANMYYIPAGLFAKNIPAYAALAAEKGLDVSALTVSNYLINNLLPVTLGNIIGGCLITAVMWLCYRD